MAYTINDDCISCEACVPEPNHRETKDQLLEKWLGLHPDKELVARTF